LEGGEHARRRRRGHSARQHDGSAPWSGRARGSAAAALGRRPHRSRARLAEEAAGGGGLFGVSKRISIEIYLYIHIKVPRWARQPGALTKRVLILGRGFGEARARALLKYDFDLISGCRNFRAFSNSIEHPIVIHIYTGYIQRRTRRRGAGWRGFGGRRCGGGAAASGPTLERRVTTRLCIPGR
jgi:hypothetical protein